MPEFSITQSDTHGHITLEGNLTATLVPELQAALKRSMDQGVNELVFDLANTTMLDSSGIGLLVAAANSAAKTKGWLQVINAAPEILHLLQAMRLVARLNVSGRAA